MALGNLRGRARLDVNNPTAQAACDRCQFLYSLDQLQRQFEWRGAALVDTGFLVCAGAGTKNCLDRPQEQNRTIILPPDPVPRQNPRPDYNTTAPWPIGTVGAPTSPGNQGFTQYVLGAIFNGALASAPIPPLYPTDKVSVLAQVAQLSGIATPPGIIDRSASLSPSNTTVNVMNANAARNFLLLYGPSQAIAFFSEGTALIGAMTNLTIGPGLAWFQDTNLGLGTCYRGAITAIAALAGTPLWAWESA